MTLLLYGLLAVVAVVGLYGLAMLVLPSGEQVAPPAPDIRPWVLAEQPLVAEDVTAVRLPVGLRGYRFAETDLLLDRLTEELRLRDAEIADLQAQLSSGTRAQRSWTGPPAVADEPATQSATQAVTEHATWYPPSTSDQPRPIGDQQWAADDSSADDPPHA